MDKMYQHSVDICGGLDLADDCLFQPVIAFFATLARQARYLGNMLLQMIVGDNENLQLHFLCGCKRMIGKHGCRRVALQNMIEFKIIENILQVWSDSFPNVYKTHFAVETKCWQHSCLKKKIVITATAFLQSFTRDFARGKSTLLPTLMQILII